MVTIEKSRFNEIIRQIQEEREKVEAVDTDINDKILIVDGLNTFIRSFSVNPSVNEDGIHIGGMTGFLLSIGYAIRTLKVTRCIIVFDGKGGSQRRRKIYPEYKSKRKPSVRYNRSDSVADLRDEKQSMMMQLSRLVEYLDQLPVSTIVIENVEADDVMAYIATDILNEEKNKVILMSSDKDFLQLVDNRISVWSPTKKKLYEPELVEEDYEVPSHNFLTYRTLTGDKSDNIKGVRGAGLKTLKKRIPDLFTDKIMNVIDVVEYCKEKKGKYKIYGDIIDNEDQLKLNCVLMQLFDVNISGNAKLKIQEAVRKTINRTIKFKFQKLILEDKLYSAIPNVDYWLKNTFRFLDSLIENDNE